MKPPKKKKPHPRGPKWIKPRPPPKKKGKGPARLVAKRTTRTTKETLTVRNGKKRKKNRPPPKTDKQKLRDVREKLAGCTKEYRRHVLATRAQANPRRPPRRWFDRCLASVTARKYARDPAAVCSAAWWRMSPAQRERTVRKLERGSPRQRRAAVAIARAEQQRADGPPRRRNGGMTDAQAMVEYERTHWGERGRRRVSRAGAPDPRHGTATKLGQLVQVVYLTRKGGDAEPTEYVHDFEGRKPELVYNEGGLMIAGGDYVIAEGGIDG